jgi:predicted O-methyltransferase YrrM
VSSFDWHAWYQDYADPTSSLSRRLVEVRSQLAAVLAEREGTVRVLSLCSGDGRDTIPVLEAADRDVTACLVELDPELAETARRAAAEASLDLEVRTGDAGQVATFVDRLPVDVLMLCGVFGNVADVDVARTVAAARTMVAAGGVVIWTRGNVVPDDPTEHTGDPAEWVRGRFEAAGFVEVAFVKPDDASYRVGVARQPQVVDQQLPERLFSFVR